MPSESEVQGAEYRADPAPLSQVACVVTAYRPSAELIENVKALVAQSGRVIVVDDGSGPGYENILGQVAEIGARVERLTTNSGIGAALNRGLDRALQTPGIGYIVTVDQDSTLPPGYVQSLLAAVAAARSRGLAPGLIGPARIHGNPVMSSGTRNGVVLGKEPIQSGLMITVDALEHIGTFQEKLFIDLVDTEFYLRASDAGWSTILADAEFDHSLGTFVEARLFRQSVYLPAGPLRVRTAATWRYYYIFRNRILVSRQYAKRHPVWVATGLWADLRHLVWVTILAPGRLSRLAAAATGVRDGILGRSGKKPGT